MWASSLTVGEFKSIGLTFSWLHLLPALAGFSSVIYLLWTSVMRGRRITSKPKTQPSAIMKLASQYWKRLAQSIRGEHHGTSSIAPIMFAAACCFLLVFWTRQADPQLRDVYVLGYDDAYHYHLRAPIMQRDGSISTTDFWTTFCRDYEPQFSTGQTLTVLTYRDMGECWSIADTHPAYLIWRDEHGKPIIR